MKKLILLISIVGVFNSNFFSQDIIFTKSQTEIKAKVLEITTDAIKYKEYDFIDGPTRNIAKSNVFMIEYSNGKKEFISKNDTKEPEQKYIDKGNNSKSKSSSESSYRGLFELGRQSGTGNNPINRVKVNIINGIQINPYFYLGLGIGFRYYFTDYGTSLIPIFVNFRTNFINKKISPYLSLSSGYSCDAKNEFNVVGFLFSPKAGVSFKLSEKVTLDLGIGYEMQKIKQYVYFYNSQGQIIATDLDKVKFSAISFDIGIKF